MKHSLEVELLSPVSGFLRSLGCTVLLPELTFFDRGIDVYGIKSSRPRTSFAVELKLTDWRKALRQAAIYQLCSDYSYVALPARTLFQIDPQPFKASGVGLLIVRPDDSVGIVIDSMKSTEQRDFYSKKFLSLAFEEHQYAT